MTTPEITYRPLALDDADDLANILGETWHQDVQGEVRYLHGLIDLATYAQQPTWTQVAQMDGRAVGMIMARAGEPGGGAACTSEASAGESQGAAAAAALDAAAALGAAAESSAAASGDPAASTPAAWKRIEEDAWTRLCEIPDGRFSELRAFFENLDVIDAQLLAESGCDPTYELVMFAVSSETRGRGVGGTLLSAAQDYLRQQGATRAFFYTDTDCNWQYYEHRGMKRVAERALAADGAENQSAPGMMSECMFVYEMEL